MKARYVPFACAAVCGQRLGGQQNTTTSAVATTTGGTRSAIQIPATYGETFFRTHQWRHQSDELQLLHGESVCSGRHSSWSAYIATWTGSNIGTVLYSSPMVDYANIGDAELTFDTAAGADRGVRITSHF